MEMGPDRRQRQLSFKTLGGDEVSYPVRGKHYVQARGYGAPPGSGPQGETCKTCRYRVQMSGSSQRWSKCEKARWRWTGGRATDILASAPACKLWQDRRPNMPGARVLTSRELLEEIFKKVERT